VWKELIILGLASKKEFTITIKANDLDKDLLSVLRSYNIPIASSCSGEGVCEKCIVSDKVLSCSLTLKSYLEREGNRISVAYL